MSGQAAGLPQNLDLLADLWPASISDNNRLGQWQVSRGSAGPDLVLTSRHFEAVLVFVENGHVERIDGQADRLAFAGRKSHFLPADKPLRRFARARWKSGVHLHNFLPCARTRVLYGESHADDLAKNGSLQAGVSVCRIRQAVAKREQWVLIFSVKPLIADLELLSVRNIERWQASSAATAATAAGWRSTGSGRWRRPRRTSARTRRGHQVEPWNLRMRQVIFASRKCHRQLSRWIHIAE